MKNQFLLVLVIFSVCISCKEFLEPSLIHESVVLLAPNSNMETNNYQLTFWWEAQQNALSYRLQVVNTDFGNIQKLVLDTLVKTNKFTHTLDPGKYQWRVRAENGSSHTPYTMQSFIVHPSSLTSQVVQLITPLNNLFTSNPEVQLVWLSLFGATQYRIQLDNHNFVDENALLLNMVTNNLSYIKMLSNEGTYQFRVRAENSNENSKWSMARNLIYDVTPPNQVTLTEPLNNKTVTKPVSLIWSPIIDAEKYELAIYKNDLTTSFSTAYPMLLNTNSYLFSAGDSNETIGWRVRAIDKAGNKGAFSDLFRFSIQ